MGVNTSQKRDNNVQCNDARNIFLSKANAQQAINVGLNEAVPAIFCRAAGGNMRTRVYIAMGGPYILLD